MGKGAPPPPDYGGAAQQTGQSGQQNVNQQTQNNRPDQSNAFGASTQWTQDPTTGKWSEKQGFTGGMGDIYGNLMQNEKDASGNPLDFGKLGDLGSWDRAISSSYDQAASRLDPQFQQREESLNQSLANQGLDPNSAAARNAQGNFGRERTDAYGSAMRNAVQSGIAEQGMNLQQRGQLAGEMVQQRTLPMQQLMQMLGFTSMPQFMGAGMAAPTNYLGGAGMLGNYQLGANDQNNQTLGGVGQLAGQLSGGAIMAASDERVKKNIKRSKIREMLPGVPEATFEYKGSKRRMRGVVAQDVEKAGYPHLVREIGGVKHVDGGLRPFAL